MSLVGPVTVIVTVFNDAEYLDDALKSIISQSILPEKIIVIDDGSTEDFANQLIKDKYSESAVKILFHKKVNGGASSARNYGLMLAETKYVCFLDVDDYWLPNNIEIKLGALMRLPSLYFGVYGGYIFGDSNKKSTFSLYDGIPPIESIGQKLGFPGGAPSYIFTRDSLAKVGGFDETLKVNEDFDLILRLLKNGYFCKGVDGVFFVRNMRDGSLTRNSNPYLLHERVSFFLSKAERNNYFSKSLLADKNKKNDLSLANNLRLLGSENKEIFDVLHRAFSRKAPNNLKEIGAFIYFLIIYFKLKIN